MSNQFDHGHETVTETKEKVEQPKRYKVIIFNDDYTSMEFVVFVLESVFHKSNAQANALMWAIHKNGRGVAGVFSFEIAETKARITEELAKQNEYPLRVTVEEE